MKKKRSISLKDKRVEELLSRELPNSSVEQREDLAWKGPFEPIPKPATGTVTYDVYDMISGFQDEAKKILAASGYPASTKELLKQPLKEKRIRDIAAMLTYFRQVRVYIDMNDPESAALSMGLGIRSAMLARIRPEEPHIERGRKNVVGGHTGGLKSAESRIKKALSKKEKQQQEADKIWSKHPTYSVL